MSSELAHGVQNQSLPNDGLSTDFSLEIEAVSLPPTVTDILTEYDAVVGERDRFLWKWIHSLFEAFTLSSVPDDRFERVRTLKTVFTIYITILDDLAEKRGDAETFQAACQLAHCPEAVRYDDPDVDTEVLEFTESVWETFQDGLTDAPRYSSFEEAFEFDLRQSFNAMEYTRLTNEELAMANLEGAFQYGSHNMVLFPYTDIDLMHSPAFDRSEFGALREVVWEVQEMARIGNWLTTWERELEEGDASAGTVIWALRNDIVSQEELEAAGPEEARELAARIRRANVEEHFLDEWQHRYDSVRSRTFGTETVDLDQFVRGMETVMVYHLASQGFK